MNPNDSTPPEFCQFEYFTHLEHILKTNTQALRRYMKHMAILIMYGETVHPTCQVDLTEECGKN